MSTEILVISYYIISRSNTSSWILLLIYTYYIYADICVIKFDIIFIHLKGVVTYLISCDNYELYVDIIIDMVVLPCF